jgi:hypothetical protein
VSWQKVGGAGPLTIHSQGSSEFLAGLAGLKVNALCSLCASRPGKLMRTCVVAVRHVDIWGE